MAKICLFDSRGLVRSRVPDGRGKDRVDLASIWVTWESGAWPGIIFEVKPDKSGQRSKGRRQVERYLRALRDPGNPKSQVDWSGGQWFDPFTVDFNGHHLNVRWASPGVAVYSLDCAPNCDPKLDLRRETLTHELVSVATAFFKSIYMPVFAKPIPVEFVPP